MLVGVLVLAAGVVVVAYRREAPLEPRYQAVVLLQQMQLDLQNVEPRAVTQAEGQLTLFVSAHSRVVYTLEGGQAVRREWAGQVPTETVLVRGLEELSFQSISQSDERLELDVRVAFAGENGLDMTTRLVARSSDCADCP